MDEQVRVLVVDDSALMRRMLRIILESDPQIRVVGEAANGRQALLRVAELRPDVITMDVRMPVMDGLETTEQLMAYHPTPILVITASLSGYDIDITFRMLDAGALDVMEKPSQTDQIMLERTRRELIRRVKILARMKVVTHLRGRRRIEAGIAGDPTNLRLKEAEAAEQQTPAMPVPAEAETTDQPAPEPDIVPPSVCAPPPRRLSFRAGNKVYNGFVAARKAPVSAPFPLIVIGASAGGPRVVHQILMGLPGSFDAAVVVVQHIAEGFGQGMAEWLSGTCAMMVRLASEGMALQPGLVVVAPDSRDLVIQRDGLIHLSDDPLMDRMPRPSVDIAMETAAEVFGNSTIGVLLTGMGRDGALGMQRIRLAGGYTFAQDENSAPIYGMPRAAVELGAVDEVLRPDELIVALQQRASAIRQRMIRSEV